MILKPFQYVLLPVLSSIPPSARTLSRLIATAVCFCASAQYSRRHFHFLFCITCLYSALLWSVGLFVGSLVCRFISSFCTTTETENTHHFWGEHCSPSNDWDDPTLPPMGLYPLLSPNTCTAIKASLNSISVLLLGQLSWTAFQFFCPFFLSLLDKLYKVDKDPVTSDGF